MGFWMNEPADGTVRIGSADESDAERRVVVIGVGNEFRRDDGVGPQVLARLRECVPAFVQLVVSDGEPARLIEAWAGASLALVVDAIRAQAATIGRLHRFELDRDDVDEVRAVSSHGLGLGDAIGLARALDLMPDRLVVHAVEATEFGYGVGLTPEVAAAVGGLTAAVLRDLAD